MIDFYMNYRASIFIDTIEATSANIQKYLQLFPEEELLPSASTEMQMSFPNPIQKNIFELRKMDNSFSIRFGTGRIDIIRSKISKIDDLGNVDGFVTKAKTVLGKILKCSDKKGYRLALALNCVLKTSDEKDLDNLYLVVSKAPTFYSENIPFEWGISQTALFDLKSDLCREKINCVTVVSVNEVSLNDNGIVANEKKALLNFDFNTVPEKTEIRFDGTTLNGFYDEVLIICKRIVDEYSKIIKNGQEE